MPGVPDKVFISDPEMFKTVLKHDGARPINTNFDIFVHHRRVTRHGLYRETGGLVGSHGQDWARVRSMVSHSNIKL